MSTFFRLVTDRIMQGPPSPPSNRDQVFGVIRSLSLVLMLLGTLMVIYGVASYAMSSR